MCPACYATAALIASGAVSTAGLAAMVVVKLQTKGTDTRSVKRSELERSGPEQSKEESDGK